jgi:asparagine synthase (glutamine-hydrolysing)
MTKTTTEFSTGLAGRFFCSATSVPTSLPEDLPVAGIFADQALRECRVGAVNAQDIAPLGDNGLAAILGSPCWKDSELAETARSEGHAAALAKAYQVHGREFLAQCSGPFSFIVLDAEEGKLLAGIDRLGRHTLYYAQHEGILLLGSSAAAVLAQMDSASLSPQGLYSYFYFHMVPSPISAYEGIAKLPAGCCLLGGQSGFEILRYWQPEFNKRPVRHVDDLAGALKSHLRSAVEKAMPATGTAGTFLSGGLDSSTVTGMLAEVSPVPHPAYAIGFDEPGYDEMEFARNTARHFGVELREYYVTPKDVLEELPTIATSYDEPFGNSSALPAYFCARKAREDGVDCLLAGDGGDEIFAGNSRYAKQQVFELYARLPDTLKKALLEPLSKALPGSLSLGAKLHSYIRQANIPLPDRLQSYNYLNRISPEEMFTAEFLSRVDQQYPLAIQRATYHSLENASDLSRMLYLDWQYTLADNDLRKVSRMCTIAGIAVSYPMLDDDLVEFSLSVPDRLKLKRGDLRHFFKTSLAGWLPQATIDKKKQGFGLPFGKWMQSYRPLNDLANESLLKLQQRGYFKAEFIDRLVKLHSEEHAAYYGELIWVLTVFELWLQGNEPGGAIDNEIAGLQP